ncbi:hypothetical protein GCM10027067_26750 [Pseudactinotalea suaedae]
MFHPWRRLRALEGVRLEWSRLRPGLLGATDGEGVVVLHPEQSQRQRRCTLAHELAHVKLGHTGSCGPVEDAQARDLAARWLIPIEALLDALRWTRDWEELADELWVDVATLQDRLDWLTDDEREQVVALNQEIERGA